jgi:hypothetical protein
MSKQWRVPANAASSIFYILTHYDEIAILQTSEVSKAASPRGFYQIGYDYRHSRVKIGLRFCPAEIPTTRMLKKSDDGL